ncbi:hypothetical protein PDL71_13665 [Lacibacter sp. MH-610]|jgi:hypothetical protein|uniref:hypothetical protein n=1 Tax=Lacibacter sp. MH-610 TaxID=3020883 RepID=UPI003891C6EC
MLKLDKLPFGIALGALAPVLGIVIYYFAKIDTSTVSFGDFIEYFFRTKALLTAVGSLSLIANIILFTLFINSRKDKTAIGIFAMTVMYGLMILYAKFFM